MAQGDYVLDINLANENVVNEKVREDATASDDSKSRQADVPTVIEQNETIKVNVEFAESTIGESDAVVRALNTANQTENNTDDVEVSKNILE